MCATSYRLARTNVMSDGASKKYRYSTSSRQRYKQMWCVDGTRRPAGRKLAGVAATVLRAGTARHSSPTWRNIHRRQAGSRPETAPPASVSHVLIRLFRSGPPVPAACHDYYSWYESLLRLYTSAQYIVIFLPVLTIRIFRPGCQVVREYDTVLSRDIGER